MNKTTLSFRLIVTTAAVVLASAACGQPTKAEVSCQEHPQGFNCSVQTKGGSGKNYQVCWDINVTCGDGTKLSANTCQDVGGDSKAASVVPNNKFTGGTCKVGKITGISVDNVKVTPK
jgi:hypothetical protein